MNIIETDVNLINDKMKFEARTAKELPPIITDYIPPLGESEGYMPLELMLISLSACLGGSIKGLLYKMRKNVSGLSLHAIGHRREEPPTYFERIELTVTLHSTDTTPAELDKVVHMAEDKYCPVRAMLDEKVVVEIQYHIEQEP